MPNSNDVTYKLTIPFELEKLLHELASKFDLSKEAVLEKGFALMIIAADAQDKGYRFGLVDKDDKLVRKLKMKE